MNSNSNVGGGFRSRLNHYLYSGDKKHVFVGLTLITAVFTIPWYFMSRGTKHQSHQDYLEKADKARSQRLSSSSASAK
ncbi:hypothetical protein AAZX31_08G216600 [Glycine max]|uniref:Uncharacterized protein n=1 Tax=Glycine max TaxID=3847 RepID=C6T4Z8_SOYBN|nr:uncharacterized protein LOC100527649 [Glycine max]ACU16780.1 unknown [Glycine max]KAG5016404.1 hypothetical protein JHK85_022540 [Glycine max]KAG5026169.1 hypothetical protein JHK86_022083 [Glycine max]KAG5137331.1 hypothetical protein JHK82_022062 [Glycine max]KAH1052481.1 hypothetical protein GYH30_022018 [Glycine max]|eukprot:XP_003531743.1 uncharacterized protein LOC100527649 [Glycine max]